MKKLLIGLLALGCMTTAYADTKCEENLKIINQMIGSRGEDGTAIDHMATNTEVFEDILRISNNLGSSGGYISSTSLRQINTALNPVLVGNRIAQRNMDDISMKMNELNRYCK